MQIGRVGNEDQHDRDGQDDEGGANCWGQVSRDLVRRLNTPCSLLR